MPVERLVLNVFLTQINKQLCTTTGIKHWGLGGWVAFAPVSCFFSWDTDAPRNPQRLIPATVMLHLKEDERVH
jgi:hypothetical protein